MPRQRGGNPSSSQPIPRDTRMTRSIAQGRDPTQEGNQGNQRRALVDQPQHMGEGTSTQAIVQNQIPIPPAPVPLSEDIRQAIQEGVRAIMLELRDAGAATNVAGIQDRRRDDLPLHSQSGAASEGSRRRSAFDRLNAPNIHQRLGNQGDPTRRAAHSRLRRSPQRSANPQEQQQNRLPKGQRHSGGPAQQRNHAKEGSGQTEGGDEAISQRKQGSVHQRLGQQNHLRDPLPPVVQPPAVTGAFIPGFGSHSPFVPRIALQPIPKGVKMPKITSYDGTKNPKSHVTKYETAMEAYADDEVLCCKAFISTLDGAASTWFSDLPEGSIRSWAELKEAFITRFYASSDLHRRPQALFKIIQKPDETLKAYFDRFLKAQLTIRNADDNLCLLAITQGVANPTS
jgi:hypothetical protein